MTTLVTKTPITKTVKKPWISDHIKNNFAMLFLVTTSLITGYILGQVQSSKDIEVSAIQAGSAQYNSVTRAFEWKRCK